MTEKVTERVTVMWLKSHPKILPQLGVDLYLEFFMVSKTCGLRKKRAD